MKYVYKLLDGSGKVIDVGETTNPELRLRQHTKWKQNKGGHGRWYGRTDITMEVVAGPMPLIEARELETILKISNDLIPTEVIRAEKLRNAGKVNFLIKKTCPHCGLEARSSLIVRWHNDNCKWK